MIDVKQSATVAAEYLKELMPAASDIALEEVELSDDDRLWRITLSASVPVTGLSKTLNAGMQSVLSPGSSGSPLSELFRQDQRRVYKILEINAETGAVRSMKIRATQ